MDPQLPTSFIPKRPVVAGVPTENHSSRAVGLLSLITAIVVIATVLSFAFVYLYQRSLVSQKTKLEQSIEDARNGVGTDFLADMKRLNARIAGVKSLLDKHIAVTPIFEALQATTLRSVQYKSFSYQFDTDSTTKQPVVHVTLNGVAKTYSTIALQSDAFTQSSLIRNPVFSNLNVDDKGNTVTFMLTFDVDPNDLSFAAFVKNHNLGNVVNTPTAPTPVTTPTTTPTTTQATNTTAAPVSAVGKPAE